jgi:4-amino-4-deoxy-L-arabinose transferase-like glycosyltransferase
LFRKIILVVCAGLLIRVLVGAVVPITDPTEGRYALIAREMVTSGDWVTPRLWIEGAQVPYLGKPPLFFWETALSIRLPSSRSVCRHRLPGPFFWRSCSRS